MKENVEKLKVNSLDKMMDYGGLDPIQTMMKLDDLYNDYEDRINNFIGGGLPDWMTETW